MNDIALGSAMLDIVSRQGPWAALAVGRPFGFTLVFYAFAWGHLNSGILRMAFALAIAAPTIGSGLPAETVADLKVYFPILLAKEVFLGIILGFVASAPLAIAMGAGGIVDVYRGVSAGNPDPAGGETPAISNLLVIVSLWSFAAMGGFFHVAELIYRSYAVWPAPEPMPDFAVNMTALWGFAGSIIVSAFVLAGPLLALMFFSDVVHLISVKFGKQINVSQMAFSSKNILLVAVLPVFMLFAVQTLKSSNGEMSKTVDIVRTLFK